RDWNASVLAVSGDRDDPGEGGGAELQGPGPHHAHLAPTSGPGGDRQAVADSDDERGAGSSPGGHRGGGENSDGIGWRRSSAQGAEVDRVGGYPEARACG